MASKYTKEEIAEARERIGKYLTKPTSGKPAHDERQRVYILVRSVAKSGMSRTMDFYVVQDGELCYLTAYIAKICDLTLTRNGLRIGGTGMDMGFAVLDHLAHKLWGLNGNVFNRDSI